MSRLSSGQRVGIAAILVIVALVVGITGLRAWQAASAPGITLRESVSQAITPGAPARSVTVPAPRSDPQTPPANRSEQPEATPANELVVHIVGAVRRPGVYHLHNGARWDEAVRAAGGPTAQANTNAINLAARLTDGTQLYIPTRTEHPEDHTLAATSVIASPAPAETTTAVSIGTAIGKSGGKTVSSSRSSHGSRSNKLTSPEQGQVDLNTATASELQRIPGIGPSMAERLISYRQQNGGFHGVEDLLEVRGIGEKKFEKIKVFVRAGGRSASTDNRRTNP